ncbi:MAG: DUF4388 domain-containing protein, partial [Alphaproteobacteria bacterium]
MTQGSRIYLVMHDQALAMELESLLNAHEMEATAIGSSRELSDLMDQEKPRMLILGVLLPDANGLEVAKRIKTDKNTSMIKVVVVSALKRSAKFSMEAKTKFGADLYLEMPMDLPDIVEAAKSMLAKPVADEEEPVEEEIVEAEAKPEEPAPAKPEVTAKKPEAATSKRFDRQQLEFREKGLLGPILLPELLLSLYQHHAHGTLVVKSFEEQREILLRDGVPIAIRTNFIHDDTLGQILIARRVVKRENIEQALEEAKKEDLKLGQVLVRRRMLSENQLRTVLLSQAKRKINSAFRWKEGSYEFNAGPVEMTDAIPLEQDVLSILIAGIGRHYDMHKLEERLYLNKEA